MAKTSTSYTLDARQEAFLRERLKSGKAESASAVVRVALNRYMEEVELEDDLLQTLAERQKERTRDHESVWAQVDETVEALGKDPAS